MAHLSLFFMGVYRVALGEEAITDFESDKVRALLAYLAVEADRAHRRDTLATLLWPDRPDSAARANLRNALASLRTAIGDREAIPPFLTITRDTIALNMAADCWVDVAALRALVGIDGTSEADEGSVGEAIHLYRGPFLEGFSLPDSAAFEDWVRLQREQLERAMATALQRMVDSSARRGEIRRALRYGRRWLALQPWNEAAHRGVMELLAADGNRSAALAQYEACRQALREELDVEPDAETVALYRRIRRGEVRPETFEPPHNLPRPPFPLLGRGAELTAISDRLADPDCRLVTLLGQGGIGKTHLALEAARHQIGRFRDGVYFVSLASVDAVDGVVPAMAQAVNLTFGEGPGPAEQLLTHLKRKEMLLVLDNLEHLLEVVSLLAEVLRWAPGAKMLVTSRIRLNLQGEYLQPVGGLDYPHSEDAEDVSGYDAVQLFLHSARRVQPEVEFKAKDLADVATICRLVRGMPLALLLAATWLRVLTLTEIIREVGEGFDFLAAGWRDVPERQQSMRRVFDHSWQLLSERERRIMGALSVFRGGCTQAAARSVTGATLTELRMLVDKSVLQRTASGRYEMHPLWQQYAAERLAEEPAALEASRCRHCAHYTGVLAEGMSDLRGGRQEAAMAEMAIEHDNWRAAWEWAVERGQVEGIERAIEGLTHFYWRRGRYREAETALSAAVEKLEPSNALAGVDGPTQRRVFAIARLWYAYCARALGRREWAQTAFEDLLTFLQGPELEAEDTRRERALIYHHLGHTLLMQDLERANDLFERSTELFRELDERWYVGQALTFLARVADLRGTLDLGIRFAREGLEVFRALGDQTGMAWTLADLALLVGERGELAEAERLARESMAQSPELDREVLGYGLLVLGEILTAGGKFSQANSILTECLATFEELGRGGWITSAHCGLAETAMHLGRYGEARERLEKGYVYALETRLRFREAHALALRGALGLVERAYAAAGQALQESVTVASRGGQPDTMARALAISSGVALAQGDCDQAKRFLIEAGQATVTADTVTARLYVLASTALWSLDQGEVARALELYALASRHPLVARSRWFEDVFGRPLAAAATGLDPETAASAERAGRGRELEATVREILDQLESQ
jgi:predicted ATPase/DNA-binding SARP family transcriptional activator